jgi:N-acetyl-anhydromuramyl-L-alanine amidase AmpD
MPHSALDAETIFGIQDAGGEAHIIEAGRSGWILFSEALGHDPNDRTGKDYSAFTAQGLTVIVRLNHGHYPQGTLPMSGDYGNFARRCANFVAASKGCHLWILGNEMNYAVERPSVRGLVESPPEGDPYLRSLAQRFNALPPTLANRDHPETVRYSDAGEAITPERYARCYRLCRNAIHLIPEHKEDRVLVGAVCPWNTHTTYPGNPQGDWIQYFKDVLTQIGPSECDGIALHTYSHGTDPALVLDESKVSTFPQYAYHFQAYRDFMGAIPANLRRLPVYITETNQDQPWQDSTTGWIQEAYAEIHRWNLDPANQKIRALVLYRWDGVDRWQIDGKPGVIRDFVEALRYPYRWEATERPPQPAATAEVTIPAAPPLADLRGSGARYRAQWMGARLPQTLHAGDVITFPVTVRNVGAQRWTPNGSSAVELSYRFYKNQQEVASEAPLRSPLPHDVAAGQDATVQAQVQLPPDPGNYTLVLDLIQNGETWFQDLQSDTLIRWMTVQPARPGAQQAQVSAPPAPARRSEPAIEDLPTDFAAPAAPPRIEYNVTEPEIVDVSAALPRGDTPYLRRSLDRIGYIVLSHTGAPPVVSLPAIAHAHIRAGYPGIAFNYVIARNGEILQACRLDESVSNAEWAAAGVNIGLEGTFDDETPPREQLDAVAHLCAWLIGQMPRLAVEHVVGLCELIPTTSPGLSFLEGPNWRRLLRESIWARLGVSRPNVRTDLAAAASSPAVDPTKAPAPVPVRAVARPAIQDIVTQLPRDPLMFYSRRAEDIHTIVVNHTGIAAETPIDVIARGFRDRGLPGILYQYFITEDGVIYQTQPPLQVVDGEKPYIANALNVAFAGEFDYTIPTQAQMKAGGALLAWLIGEYPQLNIGAIKGVSELIPHRSPGDQWLQGRRWKDLLLQEVQIAPERTPAPVYTAQSSGAPSPEIEARLHKFEQEADVIQLQISGLRAENERLRREVDALRAEPQRVRRIDAPEIVDIVNQLPQHPSLRYDERRRNLITHVAVHHTAVPPHVGPERIAELHVSEDPSRGKRPWPGIGYHYFVRADGRILRTQPLERVAYHTAGHNEYTVGVVFAGSFMNGVVPTPEQLAAGASLVAWLLQDLKIPLQHVWGHREYPDNRTACPGSEWLEGRKWRDLLYAEIVRIQRGD